MDKALLDTDILSEIFKARDPSVVARATAYRSVFPHYTLSSITIMEIVRGLSLNAQPARTAAIMAMLAAEEVLSFTYHSAELAGRIDAALQSSGQMIGRADPMIAAVAIEHNLVLVTGNTSHFQRISQLGFPLRVDNWRA